MENSAINSCQLPTPRIRPCLHCCDRLGPFKARRQNKPFLPCQVFCPSDEGHHPSFLCGGIQDSGRWDWQAYPIGTPSGPAAVPAHPPKDHGFQGSYPCTIHQGALHGSDRSRDAKSRNGIRTTQLPERKAFFVDRGHRAWPGGVPANREVKWGLRRVRHISPSDWRRCLCKPGMAPGGWHFRSHSVSSAEDAAFELPGVSLFWSRSGG